MKFAEEFFPTFIEMHREVVKNCFEMQTKIKAAAQAFRKHYHAHK